MTYLSPKSFRVLALDLDLGPTGRVLDLESYLNRISKKNPRPSVVFMYSSNNEIIKIILRIKGNYVEVQL